MINETNVNAMPNLIKQRAFESINETVQGAREEMLFKQEKYEAAKKTLSVFQEKLYFAERKAKSESGKNDRTIKNNYESLLNTTSNLDIDVSVLRDSYRSSIFFCHKMNNILPC